MTNDPIVEDIDEARKRLLDRFECDIDAYLDFLQERELQGDGKSVDTKLPSQNPDDR